MKCPYCGNPKTRVVAHDNSEAARERDYLVRYRFCSKCGKHFKTREIYKED